MIAFRCGRCTEPVRVSDEQAGRGHTCVRCGHVNVVPSRPLIVSGQRTSAVAPSSLYRSRGLASAKAAAKLAEAPSARRRPTPARGRSAPLLVVAGFAVCCLLIAALQSDGPAGTSATPSEALQQELLRKNIDQPGDPILNQLYSDISTRYFSSNLQAIPVRWEPRLDDVGKLAAQTYTLQGMFGHVDGRSIILLNPSMQGDQAAIARALCHEIVHAYLFATGIKTGDHGPFFQSALRRLADAGAFEGVVASDEERVNLRAWLDEESARLDFERAEIEKISGELEAERVAVERLLTELNGRPGAADVAGVNAKREAYNQRATDANDRIQRDRADLDHFNKEVARYNLMLVYPDGLDERGLVKPKDPATRTGRK